MKAETKRAIKLWIRRWTLRRLRLLFDALEDRLHTAEVKLREELAIQNSPVVATALPARAKETRSTADTAGENFVKWEARRSGIAPMIKPKRRRHLTAADFDRRFA